MNSERRYDDEDDRPGRRRPDQPRALSPLVGFVLIALGIVLGAAAFWAGGEFLSRVRKGGPLHDPNAQLREATPAEPLDAAEREAVNLFKKVKDSVVNVDIVQVRRAVWDDRQFEQQTGAGSGFIWDDDGRIVTNYHVIADVKRRPNMTIRIVMADRNAYEAILVGDAPEYDLAVLKFAPHTQPPRDAIKKIELGTSHDLEVGQKVFAIGNPFGLSLTMTSGIISALNRSIESPAPNKQIPDVIQHSAPINPGNSGGPLLDKTGRLIGVNSAITTPSSNGGNVGIGFAIPADTVNQVVTQIVRSGRPYRPDLGIKLYDQQKLRRARYDHGVMIEQTTPNGPAAKAGLRGMRVNPRTRLYEPGDLIVGINGETVDTIEDYERIVRKLKPGEQITVKFVRDDAEQEVSVAVGGA
jgi:protease Do-like 1, chloroplastic